jgi:hypothetical protein
VSWRWEISIRAAVTAIAVTAAIGAAEAAFSARRAIALRARERDRERTPVHLLAVPTVDSRLRFRFGSHLNEAEAARTAVMRSLMMLAETTLPASPKAFFRSSSVER